MIICLKTFNVFKFLKRKLNFSSLSCSDYSAYFEDKFVNFTVNFVFGDNVYYRNDILFYFQYIFIEIINVIISTSMIEII